MPEFTPADGLLLVALSYALCTDLRTGLIRNHLTYPAILIGILLAWFLRGTPGLLDSLAGTVLAFALLYIPYAVGWQGAGDVKLMMAVGALEGWRFALLSFLFYMAASFVLSLGMIGCRIMTTGDKGKSFLARFALAVGFGLVVDRAADEEILKTNVKWSPAIFAGTIAALVFVRFFPAGTP